MACVDLGHCILIKIEFLQIILSIKLFEPHRSAADFFMFYNGEQQ